MAPEISPNLCLGDLKANTEDVADEVGGRAWTWLNERKGKGKWRRLWFVPTENILIQREPFFKQEAHRYTLAGIEEITSLSGVISWPINVVLGTEMIAHTHVCWSATPLGFKKRNPESKGKHIRGSGYFKGDSQHPNTKCNKGSELVKRDRCVVILYCRTLLSRCKIFLRMC